MALQSKDQGKGMAPKDIAKVIEINIYEDNISLLTTKTQDKLLILFVQERRKNKSTSSSCVASGSKPPVSSLTANATPARATGTAPVAAEGLQITPSIGIEGRVDGRPSSK